MTKFDFKQWIINNKAKDKALNENMYGYRDMEMMAEAPTACDPSITTCHAFSKCNAGHQDDGNTKNYTVSAFGNPLSFYQALGSPTTPNQHVKVSNGTVFIYKGIIVGQLMNNGNTAPSSPQNICGCNPGCTNPAATNYDPAATCSDGSCIMPPAGFSECQNCCCRSRMQAKIVGGGEVVGIDSDGNPIEYKPGTKGGPDKSLARENINPTIDAIYGLIKLAEQRRRPPQTDRMSADVKSPQDFEPGILPQDPNDLALTPFTGTPIVAGPCADSHYPNGVGSPVGGYMPDPMFMIDPVTGICDCDPSDPNNTFGNLTTTGYMNLIPGTPNNTGASNGTGPC